MNQHAVRQTEGRVGKLTRNKGILLGVSLLLAWLAGCNSSSTSNASRSLLVVVIVDPTLSAVAKSEEWRKSFEKLLGYLPEDSQLAIIRCDHKPDFIGSRGATGFAVSREAILQDFKEAWKQIPCGNDSRGNRQYCGTDVVSAIELAINYASSPENDRYQRKLIIGWTDLTADPCQVKRKPFRKPTDYRPENAEDVELVLHGVPLAQQSTIRNAWKDSFKSIRLYSPGEEVNIEQHYNLRYPGGVL